MPYWRLSSFYFFYFAALGALVPYWGLYLQSRGFDAVAIGSLMALLMATKIVAPNVWGWLGDHFGHRMLIVRLASLVAVLAFVNMFWAEGFWGIALVMLVYSFFWNASLPQLEVVTFTYLGDQAKRYSLLRLWGSVGFIVTVILLGMLLDYQGTEVILWVVLSMYLGIFLASLSISDPAPTVHPSTQGSIFQVLRQPSILAFFVAVFLMQAGHGPYYAFYSIYLENHGYTKGTIGLLWGLGVLAEVLLFLFMYRLLKHWNAGRILVISMLLAALRWLLIGYFPDFLWVLLTGPVAACCHLWQLSCRCDTPGTPLFQRTSQGQGPSPVCQYELWRRRCRGEPEQRLYVATLGSCFDLYYGRRGGLVRRPFRMALYR